MRSRTARAFLVAVLDEACKASLQASKLTQLGAHRGQMGLGDVTGVLAVSIGISCKRKQRARVLNAEAKIAAMSDRFNRATTGKAQTQLPESGINNADGMHPAAGRMRPQSCSVAPSNSRNACPLPPRSILETRQVAMYFAAVLLAALIAWQWPVSTKLAPAPDPLLGFMLFVTFLQVPLVELRRAWSNMRVLPRVHVHCRIRWLRRVQG